MLEALCVRVCVSLYDAEKPIPEGCRQLSRAMGGPVGRACGGACSGCSADKRWCARLCGAVWALQARWAEKTRRPLVYGLRGCLRQTGS